MNADSTSLETARLRLRTYEARELSLFGAGTEALTGGIGRGLGRLIGPQRLKRALESADEASAVFVGSGDHDTDDLDACDGAARRVQALAQTTSATTGLTAGVLGAAGMTADFVATLTLAARTVRATAVCYGFTDGDTREEQLFRLLVLEAATAMDVSGRDDVLARLRAMALSIETPETPLRPDDVEWLGEKAADRVARQVTFALAGRSVGRWIPLAGGLFGAVVNASFQSDVARAARYANRLRWLGAREGLPLAGPNTA